MARKTFFPSIMRTGTGGGSRIRNGIVDMKQQFLRLEGMICVYFQVVKLRMIHNCSICYLLRWVLNNSVNIIDRIYRSTVKLPLFEYPNSIIRTWYFPVTDTFFHPRLFHIQCILSLIRSNSEIIIFWYYNIITNIIKI